MLVEAGSIYHLPSESVAVVTFPVFNFGSQITNEPVGRQRAKSFLTKIQKEICQIRKKKFHKQIAHSMAGWSMAGSAGGSSEFVLLRADEKTRKKMKRETKKEKEKKRDKESEWG